MSPVQSKCRSCDAPILWVETSGGKRMPIDAESVPDGNVELVEGFKAVVNAHPSMLDLGPLYNSHFATCPDSSDWRSTGSKGVEAGRQRLAETTDRTHIQQKSCDIQPPLDCSERMAGIRQTLEATKPKEPHAQS